MLREFGWADFKTVCFKAIGVLLLLAAISTVDLLLDDVRRISALHLAIEILIILIPLGGALYMLQAIAAARRKARNAEFRLEDYVAGLGRQIEAEFDEWGLTDAEKQTAMFLLKGLSHKEIARRRGRSEGTIRQQAASLYRKAGLSSRADLAAHFVQELFFPEQEVPVEEGQTGQETP